MPVISTVVSVSGFGNIALNTVAGSTYLVTTAGVLESSDYLAVSLGAGAGTTSLTVAGSISASMDYYAIYDGNSFSASTQNQINILSSGAVVGGAIYLSQNQTYFSNAGYLFGQVDGILTGGANDTILNRGVLSVATGAAIGAGNGNDTVVNSGQIFGDIALNSGNDSLFGGGGSITGDIDLGSGNDLTDLRGSSLVGTVFGRDGNDVYIVDDSSMSLVEVLNEGTDTVRSTVSYELGLHLENLVLLGTEDIDGNGTALGNTVIGNAGNNMLHGDLGSDKLYGNKGNDLIYGDQGNDVLEGGTGRDTLFGGAGNDLLRGGNDEDRIIGGVGSDTMTGDIGTSGGYDDVFVFSRLKDSPISGNLDQITDFKLQEDRIDVSAIDANSATVANEAFTFVAAFTDAAGQLTHQSHGANTLVLADVNGDGIADFRILLLGNIALSSADFVL